VPISDRDLEVLIEHQFGKVVKMFSFALRHGLTTRDELLSDYQYGIVKNLGRARHDVAGTTAEQFLHYHGICEVQAQFRLKKQKALLNECPSGHTYAYNKSRTTCPKCDRPFAVVQKFQAIEDRHAVSQPDVDFDIEALRRAVAKIDAGSGQKRVLKALVSARVLVEEEHILSAAAKVTGVSRQRVNQIVKQNRAALKRAFAEAY